MQSGAEDAAGVAAGRSARESQRGLLHPCCDDAVQTDAAQPDVWSPLSMPLASVQPTDFAVISVSLLRRRFGASFVGSYICPWC